MLEFFTENYYAAYMLVIVAFFFAMAMQFNVKSTFNKYAKKASSRGKAAHLIAREILDSNGLYDVQVTRTAGSMTDHYDPQSNTVALSETVYDSTSVAAIGITAHECGHAVQNSVGYVPNRIRSAIFPAVNIAQRSWFWLFMLGLVFSIPLLTEIGIVVFAVVLVFQIVTLPVEFDASKRAMSTISGQGLLDEEEQRGARKVLSAAAMTYIAAMAVSVAQLIRLIAQSNRRR